MKKLFEHSFDGELRTQTNEVIHPDTHAGPVTLRVANLDRSIHFYEDVIGLEVVGREDATAMLGVNGNGLLTLREVPGARPVPPRATGLFHVAILLPSQADLGRALQRMLAAGVSVGQGDHLVSEALYLSDPDGNGLEVYRDRPSDTWHWQNGLVEMATEPVDLAGLIAAAQHAGSPIAVPPQTKIGHVHLKVADLEQAKVFFHDVLGFNITAELPSALFVSAGGYHHHFGLNTWQSRGAGPAPTSTAGLSSYTIVLPNADELERVVDRLRTHGLAPERQGREVVLRDPWHNNVVLTIDRVPVVAGT